MEKKYKIIHFNEYCDDTYNKMENCIKNIKDYFTVFYSIEILSFKNFRFGNLFRRNFFHKTRNSSI